MECPVCHIGTLEATSVDYPAMSNGRWVIVQAVPALECDTCGERGYAADVVARLELIGDPTSTPLEFRSLPVYDFSSLGNSVEDSKGDTPSDENASVRAVNGTSDVRAAAPSYRKKALPNAPWPDQDRPLRPRFRPVQTPHLS